MEPPPPIAPFLLGGETMTPSSIELSPNQQARTSSTYNSHLRRTCSEQNILELATNIRLDPADRVSSKPERITATGKGLNDEQPLGTPGEPETRDKQTGNFNNISESPNARAINTEQPSPPSRQIQDNSRRREIDGGVHLVDDEWVDDLDTLPPAYTDIRH